MKTQNERGVNGTPAMETLVTDVAETLVTDVAETPVTETLVTDVAETPVTETVAVPSELERLSGVFESTPKDAILKLITYRDDVISAYVGGLKLSPKFKKSNMGKVLRLVRLLATAGKMRSLMIIADIQAKGDTGKAASATLKVLESYILMDSAIGKQLLLSAPILIA